MGEAVGIQVSICQSSFLQKTEKGFTGNWGGNSVSLTGCTAGWILPSNPCFLDVFHTHASTTSLTQPCSVSPAENAAWPGRNGRNESSFTLDLVICYWEAAFATGKKCLIVKNHSDSWETSGKTCHQTRHYIIYSHVSTRPFILQYCISVANK